MDFIPANESPLFKNLFTTYTKWLFKRRFKHSWIHQEYQPDSGDRTIYFLNHTSWWDGLIPLLLNACRFRQQARALMELKQMKSYPFFKWLGTFSIDVNNHQHTLRSLRYAVESMKRPKASLFIYPQGEIKAVTSDVVFNQGIGWLYKKLPNIDLVPIGIHIHAIRYDRPELHIWVDEKIEIPSDMNREEITSNCEHLMQSVLNKLTKTAGFDDNQYESLF